MRLKHANRGVRLMPALRGDSNQHLQAEIRAHSRRTHARKIRHGITLIVQEWVTNPPLIHARTTRNKHHRIRVPVIINHQVRAKHTTQPSRNPTPLIRHRLPLLNSRQSSQARAVMRVPRLFGAHHPRRSKRKTLTYATTPRALSEPAPHADGRLDLILIPIQVHHLRVGPSLVNEQVASLDLIHDLTRPHDVINPSQQLSKIVTQGTFCHTGSPEANPIHIDSCHHASNTRCATRSPAMRR